MSRIKEDSAAKGPKAVIECLSEEVGGMLGAVASGQLPRNEKQVTNIKQRSNLIRDGTDKAADELFVVMQRAYSGRNSFGTSRQHQSQQWCLLMISK